MDVKGEGPVAADPQERLRQLKGLMANCEVIIAEGDACVDFKKGPFWQIFQRTFRGLWHAHKQEAYKAVKSNLSDASNYLGRMESLDDVFDIIEDRFETNARAAAESLEAYKEEERQILEEMKRPETTPHDSHGGAMG